jgi:hypothetical protein
MRRWIPLAVLAAAAAAGCQVPPRQARAVGDPCAEPCGPTACPQERPACPPPRIEVQSPETIVVRTPTPKVVCEHSPAAPQHPSPGFGGAPQQPQQPMGYYPMMPAPGFGAAPAFGAGPLMGGEIRERTALGFMFDSVKIEIPWLRLKAIPQPTEVTFRGHFAPPGGFGGAPVMMGAPGFGGAPVAPGFGAAPAGGQMVFTGTQYVPVTGTMPVQVPTGTPPTGGPGFGGAPQQPGCATPPPGFGAAPPPCDSAADAVEKLKQKLKECEDLQNKIKALQAEKK